MPAELDSSESDRLLHGGRGRDVGALEVPPTMERKESEELSELDPESSELEDSGGFGRLLC